MPICHRNHFHGVQTVYFKNFVRMTQFFANSSIWVFIEKNTRAGDYGIGFDVPFICNERIAFDLSSIKTSNII